MDVNEKLRMLEEEVKRQSLANKMENILSKESFGLVLSGGGGKGAYQIGVMKALVERGLMGNIAGISGASIGAINLALFAMGDLKTAIDAWSNISNSLFLHLDESLIDFKEGVFSRDGLISMMNTYVNYQSISDCPYPLYANATNYKENGTKESIYFKLNGLSFDDIKTLMVASSALPIVYENIEYKGMTLKDGGVTDNIPIKPLYDLGIRNFLVVDLSHNASINKSKYPDGKFVHIKPYKSIGELINGTLDFSKDGAKLRMELGYVDAIRVLDSMEKEQMTTTEAMNIRAESEYTNIISSYKLTCKIDKMNECMDKINKF